MAKQTVPIQIEPGFVDGTDYEAGAGWVRGNLVRWHNDRLKPFKPWRKMFSEQLAGAARGMHFWSASNGMRYVAIATNSKIYLIDIVKNRLMDITPTGLDTSDTYNIGPGYGSGGAYSGNYNYGANAGLAGLSFIFTDFARYSLDNWGDFLIMMKEGEGKIYVYDPTTPYSSSTTSDTVSTTLDSAIIYTQTHTNYTLGASVTGTGIQYDSYVTAISTTSTASGYAITLSQPATATNASTSVTIAPQNILTIITTDSDPLRARGLIVTAERYLLLFGADSVTRRIRWSKAEDYTVWTSTTAAPTEAGSLEIATKGFLMAARKVRAGILLFSSVDVSLIQYLGPPFIYGQETLAEACGPVSSAAIQQIAERTVWLATDGLWQFDGSVTPLPCPILEKFLADIDLQKGTLVSAGAIREYGEVIWFYCSKANATNRPDAYLLWGTRNNTWSIGRLSRDHILEEEAYVFPIAVGPDLAGNTYIWAHEIDRSQADDGTVETYAETGAFEVMQGAQMSHVTRLWHDVQKTGVAGTNPSFTFMTSNSADSTETTRGPYTPQTDGSIDVRWAARQFRMKVSAPISAEWTLGKQRAEVEAKGNR